MVLAPVLFELHFTAPHDANEDFILASKLLAYHDVNSDHHGCNLFSAPAAALERHVFVLAYILLQIASFEVIAAMPNQCTNPRNKKTATPIIRTTSAYGSLSNDKEVRKRIRQIYNRLF